MARLSVCGRSQTAAAGAQSGLLGPGADLAFRPAPRPVLFPRPPFGGRGVRIHRHTTRIVNRLTCVDERPSDATAVTSGAALPPGFRVPWIRPSPTRPARGYVPWSRVLCPRASRAVPGSHQSDVSRTVEPPGTSARSLTRPSSDRAADCPDFARAACIHLLAASLGAEARSQRGGARRVA